MPSFPQFPLLPSEVQRLIISFFVKVNLHKPVLPSSIREPRLDSRGVRFDMNTRRGYDSCCGTCNPSFNRRQALYADSEPEISDSESDYSPRAPQNSPEVEDTPNADVSTQGPSFQQLINPKHSVCRCRYSTLRKTVRPPLPWSQTCSCIDLLNSVFHVASTIRTWAMEEYYGVNQFVLDGCPQRIIMEMRSMPANRLSLMRSLVLDMLRPPKRGKNRYSIDGDVEWVRQGICHPRAVVKFLFHGISADEWNGDLEKFREELGKGGFTNVSILLPSERRWTRPAADLGHWDPDYDTEDDDFEESEFHNGRYCDGCDVCGQVRYVDHLVTVYGPKVSLKFDPEAL